MRQTEVVETWNYVCPHILGGIATRVLGVVTSVYEMQHGFVVSVVTVDIFGGV